VSLYFDRVGNIWCGSYGNGSSYAHTENLFFQNHLSKADVQSWKSNSNNISWLDIDSNSDLWCILSEASGFWKFDKEFRLKMHKIPLLENRTPFDGYLKKFLFDNDNNIWCGTNKGLYKYSIATNIMHPVHYEFISDEVQGSRWIKGMIWLNDSSMVFSTYAGLYHVTNVSANPVVKPINFLQPGAYIGFETLFQDKNSLIYIKSINDSLYILKPIDNGKRLYPV
jgi:ligand-binding sensor domain-containing protein